MLISVVIPAFNVERCLDRAIDSVLTQEPVPEVIVVNDGSEDSTAEVARGYGDKITFLDRQHAGPGATRNAGIAAAAGELIAFLDADDFWLPGFLSTCSRFLDLHDEAVAVSTGLRFLQIDGTAVDEPETLLRSSPEEGFMIDEFFRTWSEHDHIRTGSCVIRKSAVDKIGGMREDLMVSQDLEFWAMLATVGKWGFIPKVLWVCNSPMNAGGDAASQREKARRRMPLAPSIEQWESRLIGRIPEDEMPYYRRRRGRIATTFVYAKIIMGEDTQGFRIARKYANDMQWSGAGRKLRNMAKLGRFGWGICARILRMRERFLSR